MKNNYLENVFEELVLDPRPCLGSSPFVSVCMKAGFNKQKKLTRPHFEKNSWCLENGRHGAFFGHMSTLTNFSLNLSLNFPEIVIGERHLKVVQGESFELCKENSCYAPIGGNGSFLGSKSRLCNFFLNLFTRFF